MNKIITAVILLFSLSTVALFTESYLMLYLITNVMIGMYWFVEEKNLKCREVLDAILEWAEGAEDNTNDK